MSDRIRIQVQFKKFVWTCPICAVEEFEDRPMEGGASYEHTCVNGHKFNQSGSNKREYNGTVNYTEAEYAVKTDKDLADKKQAIVDAWLKEVKNPPPYIEPTREELEKLKAEKQEEVDRLQTQIDAKIAEVIE